MNDFRIKQYAEEIYSAPYEREAFIEKLTERVKFHMQEGKDFDAAFDAAKYELRDTSAFTVSHAAPPAPKRPQYEQWTLVALSPFIFLGLGFAFGWWAWAWLIIPVSGVLSAPIEKNLKIVGLSPFIFIALGFAFGWWAWAWLVIPVSAVLFAGQKKYN